jgi:antitoxin component YwqK of YwqJK toxin-antitoxin module
MKLNLFFLLLFFTGILCSQEKINQFDSDGNRTGVWRKEYSNGKVRYEGQFEAGKEVGVFKYYSEISSDFPILIKTYSKSNDIATAEFFTEKGVLQSKGDMEGKERIGKWLFYNTDGKTILSEENYENGLLYGVSKIFFKSGELAEVLHYKSGKLEGNAKRFSDEGVLLEELNYSNGKLNGLATFYDTKGNIIYTGMYENDEKIGEWKYYKDGKTEDEKKLKQ